MNDDYRLPYQDRYVDAPYEVHVPYFNSVALLSGAVPDDDGLPTPEIGLALYGTDANQGEDVVYLHGFIGLTPDKARSLAAELIYYADHIKTDLPMWAGLS